MNTATQCPGTMTMAVTMSDELQEAAAQVSADSGGIGHAHLRRAVHARVFGASEPVRVGRYTVLEQIGRGAMAAVYAAYDNELDRKIAVKVLHMDRALPRQRLLREAKALARLSHPNVVHVYEVGEHDGEVFMAMELVQGTMLGQWLAQSPRSWRRVVEVFVAAARGLAAAHAQGVVHRDFKPDNVIVGDDDRVRVVDFGLAIDEPSSAPAPGPEIASASLGSAPLVPGLTQTGATLGTPGYMAPEQMEGAPADPRVDQFSLCVALYEALVGDRPFDGASLLEIRRRIAGPSPSWPASARSLPAALKQAVLRGLSERADERHSSMESLIDALTRATRRGRWRAWSIGGAGGDGGRAWEGLWWTGAGADRPATDEANERVTPAEVVASEPEDALVLEQARNLLSVDPTAAIERLAALSDGAEAWSNPAWALAAAAEARGIAQRSLELPADSVPLAMIGERVLVGDPQRCELRVLGIDGEVWWRHAADCDAQTGMDGRRPTVTVAGEHVAFTEGGTVMVADLDRRSVRSLGVERTYYDKLTIARSGTVAMIQGDQLLVWGPDEIGPGRLVIPLADDQVAQLAISADGRTLVGSIPGSKLRIWHWPTGMVRTLPDLGFRIVVADDGEQMIAGRPDGRLARWRRGVDEVEVLSEALEDYIPTDLSTDGRYLVAMDLGEGVIVWDMEEHRRMGWLDADEPREATLSPDDLRVAFRDDDVVKVGTIQGHHLRTFQQRQSIGRFGWSSERSLATTAIASGRVRHWDVPWSPILSHDHRLEVAGVAFVPGRPMLLSCGIDRSMRRWDLRTGQSTVLGTTGDMPLSVEASSDGRFAVARLHGNQMLAWDLDTDALLVGPDGGGGLGSDHEVFFSGPGGIGAWDLRTGSQYTIIPEHGDCRVLDVAPSGWVAARCKYDDTDPELLLWSRERPEPVFRAPSKSMAMAALDPTGHYMVRMEFSDPHSFESILTRSGEPAKTLELENLVFVYAFDPTGQRMTGQDGDELRQWRLDTGASRAIPGLDALDVSAVAYAPDGVSLAYGMDDGRIMLSSDPVPTETDALRSWVRNTVVERVVVDGPTP